MTLSFLRSRRVVLLFVTVLGFCCLPSCSSEAPSPLLDIGAEDVVADDLVAPDQLAPPDDVDPADGGATSDGFSPDGAEVTEVPTKVTLDMLYTYGELPVFTLEIPGDWRAELDAQLFCPVHCSEPREYIPGTLTYDNPVTGETETWEEVGIRYRGNSSACEGVNPRIGLKVSFNEYIKGRRFHGIKKLNFLGTEGDHSLIREVLAFELLRDLGVPTARAGYALVSINGEDPRIFPLVQESDDAPFIESAFPDEPAGHLYKVEGYCGVGELAYWGPDPADYTPAYQAKANAETEDAAADLIPFLACFALQDDAQFVDCFSQKADVEEFLTAMAFDLLAPDSDGVVNAGQNYSLYFRYSDEKVVLIPWDKDGSFRPYYCSEDDVLDCVPPWSYRPEGVGRIMDAFEAPLGEAMVTVYEGPLSPAILDARVDFLEEMLAPYIATDPDLVAAVEGWNWDDAVWELRDDIANRRIALDDAFGFCPPCDDSDPCTDDGCDAWGGCVHAPITGPADDGNPLTPDDQCINGMFVGTLDADGDGVDNSYQDLPRCAGPQLLTGCLDNCPFVANPDQVDSDGDGTGDACQQSVRMWSRIDTDEKVVALTFNDGWDDDVTNEVLDILAAHGAYATFFVSGFYLDDGILHAKTVKRMRDRGHLVGNLTQNYTVGTSLEEAVDEVLECEETLQGAAGITTRPLFRSPYFDDTDWLDEALVAAGHTENVRASVSAHDYEEPPLGVETMVDCLVNHVVPGDIILLHAGPEFTPEFLPAVLTALQESGYEFLTLEQMLHVGTPVFDQEWPELSCDDL